MKERIKLAPRSFKANEHTYNHWVRNDKFIIYEQKNSNGTIVAYELHKLRIREAKEGVINGRPYSVPKREALAGNEEFGRYAWSYPTKAAAITWMNIKRANLSDEVEV